MALSRRSGPTSIIWSYLAKLALDAKIGRLAPVQRSKSRLVLLAPEGLIERWNC